MSKDGIVNQETAKAFLNAAVNSLAESLGISTADAEALLKELSRNKYVKLNAPAMSDAPATVLLSDRKSGNVTSVKGGNFAVNLKKDWQNVVSLLASLKARNASPIPALIAVCKLVSVNLNECGAAIVMTLQPEGKADISTREKEAAFLSKANGFLKGGKMSLDSLHHELQTLEECGCISQSDGVASLEESIVELF